MLYVDAGWIRNVQIEVSPRTPRFAAGALHCMAERHRYERIAGEPYCEEAPARAATFPHTALRLRPFTDCNASTGVACVRAYMDGSGTPVDPQPGDWARLAADIRSDEVDLTEAARLLRDWAA
ncbi:hypothetical protein ACFSL4_03660 [Streptomyces caeni]|uniref:Uncharacterized protein n=1 Tax=Streptomyces caeni TaxID=2307231 RepID=A0ABW4ILE9_9ACTN